MAVWGNNIVAIPPGDTIKEMINDRRISQKELATMLEITEKHMSKLINGEVRLTPEMAIKLSIVLGVTSDFWLSLEAQYRESLMMIEAESSIEDELEIAEKFPIFDMEENGWVAASSSGVELVFNLRKFFNVLNLQNITAPWVPCVACRREDTADYYSILAWAQKAKLESAYTFAEPIDIENLNNVIYEVSDMQSMKIADVIDRLKDILGSCGIVLTLLPYLTDRTIHGASFYDRKKIVLAVAVDDINSADNYSFWYNLFHEIGHIVLGHINRVAGISESDEDAADDFARKWLSE